MCKFDGFQDEERWQQLCVVMPNYPSYRAGKKVKSFKVHHKLFLGISALIDVHLKMNLTLLSLWRNFIYSYAFNKTLVHLFNGGCGMVWCVSGARHSARVCNG